MTTRPCWPITNVASTGPGCHRRLIHAIPAAATHSLTQVGKPLRADLEGIYSARRGTYRVLYRINDLRGEVVVLRIDHRRDVYRT